MSAANLTILDNQNRQTFSAGLHQQSWLLVCLCAAWCNTCASYQKLFATLAPRYPAVQLVWIDIEDQADIVGDLEIENFPTVLIQHGHEVLFFGTMLPEIALAERLLQTKLDLDAQERALQAAQLAGKRSGQASCDLWQLLQQHGAT